MNGLFQIIRTEGLIRQKWVKHCFMFESELGFIVPSTRHTVTGPRFEISSERPEDRGYSIMQLLTCCNNNINSDCGLQFNWNENKQNSSGKEAISHICFYLLEWMNGWLVILRPFQQYFSYIRTMGAENERLWAVDPRLRLERSPP